MAAAGWVAGAFCLGVFAGLAAALAFALSFALVTADFLWMAKHLGGLLGTEPLSRSRGIRTALGLVGKTLLLAGGVYAILKLLPRESLGVILGIGGPLMLLSLSGATRKRG
jgi:hypothetical protein